MAIKKRLAFALVTLATVSVQAMPAQAQRYCQRELNDDVEPDVGCTAPVGGGVGRTDPRFSSTASPTHDKDAADLNAFVEAIDLAGN
ncbi:hypothetical protein C8J46_1075 [Sphingomonas sp. PP-F2F-A104-K0414]|uniref:hypothetical protein n=1 Tax=Sphingomonas sp. PP-F2F-A104-K0414 TaxID=2135661 RepID=UPI0010501273|nr:hypothetical protein [Sphingomonas sp. PP-F2F-A104-K0414]TCP96975.1 hypothetical protein C8J46_1075 [Sphingomonas sp. PP-F2F-A104-K0414]